MEATESYHPSENYNQDVNMESEELNPEMILNPSDATIKALTDRISTLELELKIAHQKNRSMSLKIKKALREKLDFEVQLSKYFEKDQIEIIRGKKKVKWSLKSIAKALYIRKRGKSVLDSVRRHIAPLPCLETLNKRFKNVKFTPGIIDTNLKILTKKCEKLSEPENYFYLGFDEMSIIPGKSKDPSTKMYIGGTTLPNRSDALADQMILFQVMGLHGSQTRVKSNVGFHLTKKGITTGEDLKKFIIELVIKVENEAKIKIKGISFDLSALDCSMLKSFGVKFNMENKTYYAQHPNRKDDVLLLSPDGTHNSKNLNQHLKNKDIIISRSLQEEFDLHSNIASKKEVEKLFKNDLDNAFKLMPNVTDTVINTKHFAKMDPKNASKFHSPDVVSAINYTFIQKSEKQNSTAFVLTCFHHYHRIITSTEGWSKSNVSKYNDDIEFLDWFSDRFLPNIKIGTGNTKSVYGTRMGIYSIIYLSKLCFEKGFEVFIPSRLLTNPVENQFSILRDLTPKPSSVHVIQSLRIMSMCPFNFHPRRGVYKWDEEDTSSLSYIEVLKQILSPPQSSDVEDVESIKILYFIDVPENITWIQIHQTEEKYSAFICHMSLLLNSILSKDFCRECSTWIEANQDHSYQRLQGYQLLHMRIQSDSTNYKCVPSIPFINMCLRLEYLFQKLSSQLPPNDEYFEENFHENVSAIPITSEDLHCLDLVHKISTKFLTKRLHTALHSRYLQKALKYSSATLSSID
jgi:hypothetical protein